MPAPPPPTQAPIRKRMKRREIPGSVRFITFSCEHRLPILGTPEARDTFVASFAAAKAKFHLEVIAWVIMPEHVHMLVRPANGVRLDRVLLSMKLSATQRLLASMRQRGDPLLPRIALPDGSARLWQPGGGFDRNVRSDAEMQREIRYIHRNPVKAELVPTPEDWPWSSARFWIARHAAQPRPSRPSITCDWPPGDPRAWAMWTGFV